MDWEDELRAKLNELKGNRAMHELAEDVGLNVFTLYKILSGDRGIGSTTLMTLRNTRPDLVAGFFLPANSPTGETEKEQS